MPARARPILAGMTGTQFNEWLSAMGISGAEAARLLGVTPNTITRYRKRGGPAMLDAACAHLRSRARHASRVADAITESRDFSICTYRSWGSTEYAIFFDGEPIGDGYIAAHVRTIAKSSGRLGPDQRLKTNANNVTVLDPSDAAPFLAKYADLPWVADYAKRWRLELLSLKTPVRRSQTRPSSTHFERAGALSTRAHNAMCEAISKDPKASLDRTDAQTIAAIHIGDLLRIPNFGRKSLREVEAWLQSYGLSFGRTLP